MVRWERMCASSYEMQEHLAWGKNKMDVIITSGHEGRRFHEWDVD